ncbi:MAG: hypothetical protein AB3N63_00505 [Puniceicoccaceae bacterium]
MDPFQLRQAVREVRDLRKNILEKQLFRGYSGRARALGGCVALAAALGATVLPINLGYSSLFLMWGGVFVCAVGVNYGALAFWLLRGSNYRDTDLSIVFEVLPVWIVGGLLTLALWKNFQFDLLYGCWMSLFGLAQTVTRRRLPKGILWVGVWYIVCGTLCLALPGGTFMQPLIMGIVFFIGEFWAGLVMHTSSQGSRITGLLNLGSK